MDDLSVIWLSSIYFSAGMYIVPHIHEYFHFSYNAECEDAFAANGRRLATPFLSCFPPLVTNPGMTARSDTTAVNVMFMVDDKKLFSRIAAFPFHRVPKEKMHADLLLEIVGQVRELSPPPELVNSAFSYYIQLVMEDNRELPSAPQGRKQVELCNRYIEEHYAENIELADIAEYIGHSRNYTSTLYSAATGITLIEQLNSVRVRHACELVAYSKDSHKSIMAKCGFRDPRNYTRVFKKYVGLTPNQYRTSHNVKDLRFGGDEHCLDIPYPPGEEYFTYAVYAGRKVYWKSARQYLHQSADREKTE